VIAGQDDVVFAFRKNATEEVRVCTTTFKGMPRIDLRVWALKPAGDAVATPKGLNLSPADLPQLRLAVEALERAIGTEAAAA